VSEREPTGIEAREAEALARALDGKGAGPSLPEDGLATAAFLRFSRDGGTLAPDRSREILAGVLANAREPSGRRASWWRWLLPAIAAAALLCVPIVTSGPTSLPSPRASLVRAQAKRAPGLEADLRAYRSEVLSALSRRYLSILTGCAAGAEEWLDAAAEAHRRADHALARRDRAAAREALARVARVPAPGGMNAEDARVVRQDLFARLAEIDLAGARPQVAIRWASRGLALGDGGDVFTAALRVARGRAREALGEDLAAVEDYHRALVIDDALLRRALEEEDR